jgi:hypothetical protein
MKQDNVWILVLLSFGWPLKSFANQHTYAHANHAYTLEFISSSTQAHIQIKVFNLP